MSWSWAPLWSKIVDSSIWSEPDHVVKVFLTMLAKKDKDHVVRGNAYNIAQWAKKTEDEVLDALRILSSPDSKRREGQAHEGRRIEKVEDGYLVLNGEYYRALIKKHYRRNYKTNWEREKRKRIREGKGSGPSSVEQIADQLERQGKGDDASRAISLSNAISEAANSYPEDNDDPMDL